MSDSEAAPTDDRAFPLSAEHESTLRTLAADALERSFTILMRERVIPRSRYRPWIAAGRDYEGYAAESEGPLSKALEAALPDRFRRIPLDVTMDYPWGYGHALLQAAVAAATQADEPYEVSSPSVQAVIDEFINKVQSTPATTALQVVTDVDVAGSRADPEDPAPVGQTLRIAGVDIVRVDANAEPYIERELRSAGYDVDREYVVSWPGPASLLVARVAEPTSLDVRFREAQRRLRNVVTAVRLSTGASASPLVTIEGEPGNVRSMHPLIRPHRMGSMSMRLAHRPVSLTADHVVGLEALATRIDEWLGQDELATSPLLLAVGRLNRSFDRSSSTAADIVIDVSTGLEAALSGTDAADVGLRLRVRAADLLATDDDPGEVIYEDVKALYEIRSAVIHGSIRTAHTFSRAIGRVSSTKRGTYPNEQLELALDRWRDLLRRAILARAALSADPAPWPLSASIDVDRPLRSEAERSRWRRHIHDYWSDVGLASALLPAARMQLPMSLAREAVDGATPDATSGA